VLVLYCSCWALLTLEIPAKLRYDVENWLYLQQTLYQSLVTFGGGVEVGAIINATVLAFLLPSNRTSFLLASAAAACLVIAFFSIWILEPCSRSRPTGVNWRSRDTCA
jgi:hypothetical protein